MSIEVSEKKERLLQSSAGGSQIQFDTRILPVGHRNLTALRYVLRRIQLHAEQILNLRD